MEVDFYVPSVSHMELDHLIIFDEIDAANMEVDF